jgi:hypothetical protein
MGALAQLASSTLSVEPGRSATTAVTIRNNGSVVDRFTFEALGPLAEWVTFSPDSLSLFPEASGTVNIVIAPPRSSAVAAGTVPYGVKVTSAEDPEGGTAEEGTIDVAPFSDVSLELLPRIVHGGRVGLARLAVDNRSNIPYDAEIAGADASAALGFGFRPSVIQIPAGGAEFVKVRIRPVKTFWRGVPANKPFQLELTSATAPHPPKTRADGSMLQEALLPRWVMAAIAALIALAVILAILWFAFLKPQIHDTAVNEAKKQLADAGLTPASSTSGSGGGAGTGTTGGSGSGSSSQGTTVTTLGSSSAVGSSNPSSPGVTVNRSGVANGNGNQVLYTVPAGHTLQITDMLIQNAAGDNGTLSLARGGSGLMQWSMADFRDLDYHWVSPVLFTGGSTVVMSVTGCTNTCHPAVYYAGMLVNG